MFFILPLPPNGVGKGIMFLGCPSTAFIRLSRQILLLWYYKIVLNNFDKTDVQYSLAHTGDILLMSKYQLSKMILATFFLKVKVKWIVWVKLWVK